MNKINIKLLLILSSLKISIVQAHGGVNLSADSFWDMVYLMLMLSVKFGPYLLVGIFIIFIVSKTVNEDISWKWLIWPMILLGGVILLLFILFIFRALF